MLAMMILKVMLIILILIIVMLFVAMISMRIKISKTGDRNSKWQWYCY